MFELLVNVPFSTILRGPDNVSPPVPVLYVGALPATVNPICVQVAGTPYWSVTFTPNVTGLYTLYAFGQLQFRTMCNNGSFIERIKNIEDEALGSWQWNKSSGELVLYRQDGTELTRYVVKDELTSASREIDT